MKPRRVSEDGIRLTSDSPSQENLKRRSAYSANGSQFATSKRRDTPKTSAIVPIKRTESRILVIRGHKVLLDSDLAEL